MHIENLLREMDQFSSKLDKMAQSADEGRGMENIPTCPHCARATILIEHEYTPQLRFTLADDEPEREATHYTCEWCGSEIDQRDVTESMSKKPAGRGGEDEWELARRAA